MAVVTVAVDVGQSGTRSLGSDGADSRNGAVGGYWSDAVESIVVSAVGEVAAAGECDIGIGLTGYHRMGQSREGIVAALALAGYYGRVSLGDDAVTAHLGAFTGGPGAVISAGTGAVALYRDDRRAVRVDGLGHELGDRGSGYWIGRTALRAALVEHESGPRRGQESALLAAARRWMGDEIGLPAGVGASVEQVASFARDVSEAARAGDVVATRILTEAGRELATSARIAIRRGGGPADVCLVGGLADAAPVLTDAVNAGLPPGCRLVDAKGDALDGALLLARFGSDSFGDLVSSFTIDRSGVVTAGGRAA